MSELVTIGEKKSGMASYGKESERWKKYRI